jgi:hypothetical protein
MGTGRRARAFRFGVSLKDPDVAAAFRDVEAAMNEAGSSRVIELSKIYAPPLQVGCDFLPRGVTCGRAKSRSGTEYIATSGVRWKWASGVLSIIEIPGLTVGQEYDINLIVTA